MRKLLTTHGVRLLLAFLCIVTGFANAKAATYTVVGNSTAVFGASWNTSYTDNDMTLSNGVYTWTSQSFTGVSDIQFKVVKDHSWNTNWGGSGPDGNYQLTATSSKSYTLTITFSGSAITGAILNEVQVTPTYLTNCTVAVVGDGVGCDINSIKYFSGSNGTYTLTVNNATTGWFKLTIFPTANKTISGWDGDNGFNAHLYGKSQTLSTGDNTLTTSYGAGNIYFPAAGNYTLTVSNITTTGCTLNIATASAPVVPIFLHYWGSSSSMAAGSVQEMTSSDDNLYSITLDLNKGDYVLFTNSASKTWNAGTQYAQSSGNHTFSANDSGTAVSGTSNVYQTSTTTGGGNWTFTFNKTSKAWTAVQNSVSYDPLYLRHWTSDINTGSAATMTTTDNVNYTVSNVSLARGEYIVFSTVNSGAWNSGTQYNYNGSADKTFNSGTTETASTSGTKCYVTPIAGTWNFTFNTSNGQWTPTLVSAAAQTWYLKGDLTDWTSNAAGDTQMSTTDNITYTKTITINERTTSTKNLCLIDGLGDWNDVNANHRYYSTTTVNPTPSGHTVDIVKGGDNNNIVLAKGACGTYTFSYNVSTGKLTVTGPAVVDIQDWYLLSEFDGNTWKLNNSSDKFTYDENSGNYVLTKSISTTADTHFLLSKKVASAELGWNEISGYRYCAANGTDQAITFGTAYPVGQYNDGSYYIPSGKNGTCTFTLNASGTSLTVTFEEVNKNTGHMYIIGRANGGVFQANLGTEMTKIAEGVFQADNVELMSGADFSFTAKLGNDAEDWATANKYRYFNTAGYCIEVQDNQVGTVADNTTGTEFGLQDTGDGATGNSNFKLKTSGAYRITVNTNTMKVHFEKMYASLYMFGKGFSWGSTTPNAWDPTSAIPMTTTDGKIYHLDAVKFENVEAAGFIFSTVVANNNDDGGKQWVAKNGFFPSNEYDYVIHKNDQQNDINKALTMVEGSTDDAAALTNFNSHRWTIWGTEVAADNAKYNVVVDIEKKTVTLKENVPIKNELTIRLEQTDNLKGKYPAVQVWITDNNNMLTKYQGAWIDGDEGSTMDNQPAYGSGSWGHDKSDVTLDGNMWYKCREYTSYDNRKWWEWEIGGTEFRIASIHFYRNDDYNDTPSDPNGDLSRRSGVLYYTWVDRDIEDHTADYYVDHVKEAPDCATMLDDHLYVYFVNTPGWSTVYCHAWDENGNALLPHMDSSSEPADNAGWPGDICIVVGYNEDGFAVYRYDFGLKSLWEGKTIAGVIFNSGPGEGGSVAEQTGDFTPFKNGASYDYVGRVSLGRSLGNIIAKGVVKGPKYDVEDDLVVVYYNPGESGTIEVPYIDEFGNQQIAITNYTGAYYAKDINNANEKSFNYDGKLDYVFDVTQFNAPKPYVNEEGQTIAAGEKVELLMQGRTRYDQSNWVRLVKANDYSGTSDWTGGGLVNKKIKGDMLSGQLIDNLNPTMIVEELPADAISATTYVLNDYIAPHFNDDYSVNDNGDLFFVRPKANEVAHITWAVYKGNNEFYTPDSWAGLNNANTADGSTTGDMFNHGNAYDLKGGFKVASWAFAGYDAAPETLTPNQAYQFDAIIRYKDNTSNGAPIITPQGGSRLKEGARVDYDDSFDVNNSQFEVYPVNVNPSTWIVTGIDEIETDAIAKEVVAVKYYNIMGVEQRELQPGVNIVVTIYNDGSRSSAKILK